AELAGKWYSASKDTLEVELNSYLKKATPHTIDGEIISLISPHAGFVYSGSVAAYGFKAIKPQDIKTVIVVGFNHRRRYDGIALLDSDGFETPLGIVRIDRRITEELIKANPKIYNYPVAFSGENSVEMQIPFLQMALKDFEIVLIAIGNQNFENCEILGKALYEVLKDKDKFLLIASTDMSHHLSYKEANKIDKKTISVIKEFDANKLYAESSLQNHRLMCGYGAVCATMIASKMLGADKVEILKYANSGDTAGDKSRVVGYLSAAIVKGDNNMLNEGQKKKMLKLARDSITHYLKEKKRLSVKEDDPILNREMGAFVTLHKRGSLRGCIGNLVGRGPFCLTVRDMAIEAATGDPRFQPVTLEEMDEIDIEISALSPMEKINDTGKIEMGKHGVLVRRGFASGVYLPQVATETGWNREQFMNSLCGHKAGMPPDAWKKGDCDIFIFTAEVFGEKE
ncbi:MAG: AmmeMemoRadiSam system protein B, partial [Candidatus Omnitrophota bacterium]